MEDIKYMLHPIQVCVSPSEREKVKYLYIQSRKGGKVPLEQYLIGNIV